MALDTDKEQVMNAISSLGFEVFRNGSFHWQSANTPDMKIYKDGKIYLRRTFNKSGEIQITGLVPETEYKIVGKYVYLNENGQKVENTFYEGSFTTKGYDELGSIEITKENNQGCKNY